MVIDRDGKEEKNVLCPVASSSRPSHSSAALSVFPTSTIKHNCFCLLPILCTALCCWSTYIGENSREESQKLLSCKLTPVEHRRAAVCYTREMRDGETTMRSEKNTRRVRLWGWKNYQVRLFVCFLSGLFFIFFFHLNEEIIINRQQSPPFQYTSASVNL